MMDELENTVIAVATSAAGPHRGGHGYQVVGGRLECQRYLKDVGQN